MNRRWICNDIWMDTLPHFDRAQLGLKMALLSPRFDVLVDTHFDGKSEWTIRKEITISKMGTKAKLSVEKNNGKSVIFPMPDHQMHNKIRFENLWIEYIDHSVFAFLRDNKQIWNKGTNLSLYMPSAHNAKNVQSIWDDFINEIWPIFAPNIRHLSFSDSHTLKILRRHTSPTILSNLNISSIHSAYLLPDAIADDGPNATDGQALSKWLNTPRSGGQPKQLSCRENVITSETAGWVNSFKEEFLRATISSACYIIQFKTYTSITQFELMNERTNEMLTLDKKEDKYANGDWLLKRCQIGQTATVKWENKKTDNLNTVRFHLHYEFGPLSPQKAGQINAKSCLKMNPGPSGQRKKKEKII